MVIDIRRLILIALMLLFIMPSASALNTSISAVKFETTDCSFASDEFTECFTGTFNTTAVNTTIFLFTSFNAKKISGGGSNLLFTRIMVNGTETETERLVTLETGDDIVSTGAMPLQFFTGAGSHNVTLELNRSGAGSINITNIDLILLKLESVVNNGTFRFNLTDVSYSHSSPTFVPAFNYTVNQSGQIASPIFNVGKFQIEGTATAIGQYFYEDFDENQTSPHWRRGVSGDVGSMMGIFINLHQSASLHNHTINSLTSAGTVSVNGSIMDFDLFDNESNEVNHFQVSNNLTNITEKRILGAGTHLLVSENVTILHGNGVMIAGSVSLDSNSGGQTVTIVANSTTINETQCFTEKEKFLSSTGDVGNVFFYTICNNNLSVGSSHNFTLWITNTKSIDIFDESLSGFEVTNFSTSDISLPPIANEIITPENNSLVSGSEFVAWLPFTNADNYTITLRDFSTNAIRFTLDTETPLTNISVDFSIFPVDTYILEVEGISNFGTARTRHVITIESAELSCIRDGNCDGWWIKDRFDDAERFRSNLLLILIFAIIMGGALISEHKDDENEETETTVIEES